MSRTRLRRFVFLFVPLVVLLAAAEFGLRATGTYLRKPVYYTLPAGVDSMAPGAGEDPDLFWVRYPYLLNWTLDEIAAETAANRVVTLGGSIAAGWTGGNIASALPVSYDETFSGLAVKDAIEAGYDVRGIVLAQGAYSSHQSRVLMSRIVRRGGRPTIVVVCNGVNDAWKNAASARRQTAINHRLDRRIAHELNRSRAFAALRYVLAVPSSPGRQKPAGPAVPFVSVPEYVDNLLAIARLTESVGGSVVLVSQPMPDRFDRERLDPYFDAAARFATSDARVHFVDVRPRFDKLRRTLGLRQPDRVRPGDLPDSLFTDEIGHQTPLAMSVVADALYSVMRDEGLLIGPAR